MRKLGKLGFHGPYSGGSHQYMVREDFKLFVPNPHKGDIGKILLSRIIKELGISISEFMKL
jgi:predicted RNA binding protein YcfA (HicA-like mRNA interferase family)